MGNLHLGFLLSVIWRCAPGLQSACIARIGSKHFCWFDFFVHLFQISIISTKYRMRKMKEVSEVAFVLLLCFVKGSYEACTDMIAGIDSTKVATMCTDSVITGTTVYIDTSLATTMTLSAGTVCSCDVRSQHGTSMNVTSYFAGTQGSDCGSTINYVSSSLPGSSRNVSCETKQFVVTAADITINFIKIQAPYNSNYCVSIALEYCTSTEFQCNNGECIPDSGRCDNIPDCFDSSDETNCDSVTCVEGQVLCDDGVTCITPDKWCDGTNDCPDSSDEPASCGNLTTASPTPTTSSPPVPLVTITCTNSLHAPTTAANTGISTTKQNEDNTSACPVYTCILPVAIVVGPIVLIGLIGLIVIIIISLIRYRTHNRVVPLPQVVMNM